MLSQLLIDEGGSQGLGLFGAELVYDPRRQVLAHKPSCEFRVAQYLLEERVMNVGDLGRHDRVLMRSQS
jgi:hypothetical protein